MRILLVTPVPPDAGAPGAIPVLLHAELVGLTASNDVTLVTPAGPDASELDAVDRLRVAGHDVRAVPRHLDPNRWRRRARMAATWARGRDPWRTVWFREPAVQQVLDRVAAEHEFDVVAVEDNAMGTYRFPSGLPAVLTEEEVREPRPVDRHLGPPRAWPGALFREADWVRWTNYQRRVWRRFDAIQVYTERDARAAIAIDPSVSDRIRVTPFGVELPAAPLHAPEPGVIGFVGNYTHPPNVDAAIWLADDILPRVRATLPTARLRLAGWAAPPALRERAGDGVEVVGAVDDVNTFLADAAVVAAPIRTGGGMRMKVLHAMALGKPVVTTTLGAEGIVGHGPLPAVVVDDAPSLAGAIVDLLTNDDRRRELGDRAHRFVREQHGPRAVAGRLEQVYAEVIERHRRARGR